MKCIKCGSETQVNSGNSEIIIKCPNCGWSAVTTYMSEIEDDLTSYSIIIEPGNSTEIEMIKLVAEKSGMNVLQARNLLLNGGLMISETAVVIKEISAELDLAGIDYRINPSFPY